MPQQNISFRQAVQRPQPHVDLVLLPTAIATITMLSNTLRTTSRRIISTASSQTKRAASSTSQAFKHSEKNSNFIPVMAAATMGCFGLMSLYQEDETTKNAQCLDGKSDSTAKEVEAKFGTYWPRNIMILFGPPGGFTYYVGLFCIRFGVLCSVRKSCPQYHVSFCHTTHQYFIIF